MTKTTPEELVESYYRDFDKCNDDPRFYINTEGNFAGAMHKPKKETVEFHLFFDHRRVENSPVRAYKAGEPTALRLDWELADASLGSVQHILDLMKVQAWGDIEESARGENIPNVTVEVDDDYEWRTHRG